MHEYGLDGSLRTKAMVPRVQILPGYLERSWETGTICRTIMCAEGGGYRNEQTGLEIITMQKVQMRTCYNDRGHELHELFDIAKRGNLAEGVGHDEGKYWCGWCWRMWRLGYRD